MLQFDTLDDAKARIRRDYGPELQISQSAKLQLKPGSHWVQLVQVRKPNGFYRTVQLYVCRPC